MPKANQTENIITFSLVALGIGGACALYYWKIAAKPTAAPVAQTSASPVAARVEPAPSPSPSIQFPVPEEKPAAAATSPLSAKKLPALDDSDQTIQDWLNELFGKGHLDSLVNTTDLIRRIVITVENSTEPHAAGIDVAVFIPTPGQLLTEGKGDDLVISRKNYARYMPYVSLIEKVSTKRLVDAYIHFYPLIQSAYHDVNSQGYFNDRLVGAIDNLLATPEVDDSKAPVQLTQGGVYYKYADTKLEACSSGQKALLRIGAANARIIKAKLKQLKNSLTRFGSSSSSDSK
jgi:hypothetical protein